MNANHTLFSKEVVKERSRLLD